LSVLFSFSFSIVLMLLLAHIQEPLYLCTGGLDDGMVVL